MKPQWSFLAASKQHSRFLAKCSACLYYGNQYRALSTALRCFTSNAATNRRNTHPRLRGSIAPSSAQFVPRSRYISTAATSADPIDRHAKTVEAISASVRGYYDRKEKFRIYHGSTNSTRSGLKKNLVDTSSLSHVLGVDTERKTCLVEPNVPMDRLVEATLKHGLVPPVVVCKCPS